MKLILALCMTGVLATPCIAGEPSQDLRKAEMYAMAAKQYAAAGKPVTLTMARHFAELGEFYRSRAGR